MLTFTKKITTLLLFFKDYVNTLLVYGDTISECSWRI